MKKRLFPIIGITILILLSCKKDDENSPATIEGQGITINETGFETGADDYITKPFNFEILESRIKNLIKQRKILATSGKKYIQLKAKDIEITSVEEIFLYKACVFHL